MSHLLHTLAFASGIAIGGGVFGVVYFTALRRNVDLYGTEQSPLGLVTLIVGRIAAAIMIFALPLVGVLPLLAALFGLFIGRVAVSRPVSK